MINKNMIMLNGNREVLLFNLGEKTHIEVLNNEFLPFALKDYIKTTSFSNEDAARESNRHISVLRDYLASRTLNLSRTNAKAILNSSNLPQSIRTDEKLKIVYSCQALSMTDNIWIKEETSNQKFEDVNLRSKNLKDAAYAISLLGKTISVNKDILAPDINTTGMFAKTWVRDGEESYLWKTDSLQHNENTEAEIKASEILDCTNIKHIQYSRIERDSLVIASCRNMATDSISLVSALDVRDHCVHTGIDFLEYVRENFLEDFSNMVVFDYVLANPDRHFENFQFLVDNETNTIIGMAPLFDHNQALIADQLQNSIDDLIYDPTGQTMKEAAISYFPTANIILGENWEFCATLECKKRWAAIKTTFTQ